MGAACSLDAHQRYRTIKEYIHSKECMTFDVVEGFLPPPESNRSPVIFIGENHNVNDSDVAKANRSDFSREEFAKKTSCATALRAMNDIVSKCSSPGAKVYFVIEDSVRDLYEMYRQRMGIGSDKIREFSTQHQKRYGLANAIKTTKLHAHLYEQGLGVIKFDMFYHMRGFFQSDNYMTKNMLNEPSTFFNGMMNEMIAAVSQTLISMGNSAFDIEGAFDECYNRMTTETEMYRWSVQKYFDKEKRKDGDLKGIVTKQMNDRKLSQFKRDFFGEDTGGDASHGEEATEKDVYVKWDGNNYHFSLFRVVYWVYCFTSLVIDSVDQSSRLNDDLTFAREVLEIFMEKIIEEPYMANMFNFITLCGDFITYSLYLRIRVMEQNTNSIFVVYGGSAHTDTMAMLLSRISTHKRDFIKISDRVCEDEQASALLHRKCTYSGLVSANDTVRQQMLRQSKGNDGNDKQPWFMSTPGPSSTIPVSNTQASQGGLLPSRLTMKDHTR